MTKAGAVTRGARPSSSTPCSWRMVAAGRRSAVVYALGRSPDRPASVLGETFPHGPPVAAAVAAAAPTAPDDVHDDDDVDDDTATAATLRNVA